VSRCLIDNNLIPNFEKKFCASFKFSIYLPILDGCIGNIQVVLSIADSCHCRSTVAVEKELVLQDIDTFIKSFTIFFLKAVTFVKSLRIASKKNLR
jgi:hypothetical protein